MTLPSHGIIQQAFRDAMPPYQLSADLLTEERRVGKECG